MLNRFGVFGLVLTPTRELAFQIGEQFTAFGSSMPARVLVVTGGMDMVNQSSALAQRPHVVVATPGRLADMLADPMNNVFKRTKILVRAPPHTICYNTPLRNNPSLM